MNRQRIAWVLFLLTPIVFHPANLRAQTTVRSSGGGGTTFSVSVLASATFCSDAGSSDAYACNFSPAPASLAAMTGAVVTFKAGTVNTGAATFAPNGLAATPIVKVGQTITTALVTNDIRDESYVTVVYDGTSFVCLSCDGNRAALTTANTWTAAQTSSSGGFVASANGVAFEIGTDTTTGGSYAFSTPQTPDGALFTVGTTNNSIRMVQRADTSFDFNNGPCGTTACVDPTFSIHSEAQDTTQYNARAVWGEAGGPLKALTAGVATSIVRIPVANNSRAAGEIVYEIYATDGTDMQVRSSRIRYAMTNKAGTEACNISAMDGTAATNETDDDNVSSITAGTLTYAVTCSNVAADTMDILFNAVSSLSETTLQAKYSVKHLSPGAPARQ